MRRDTDEYRAHRQARAQLHELTVTDEQRHARDAAARAVQLARQHLDHVRRQRIRGQAGNADVAQAEHALDTAIAELTAAHGGHSWTITRPQATP